MLARVTAVFVLSMGSACFAQTKLDKLSVVKIMRDPKWIGTSPSQIAWSYDGKHLYFDWNPDGALADSLYSVTLKDHTPAKLTAAEKEQVVTYADVAWNHSRSACTYASGTGIFFVDTRSGKTQEIFKAVDKASAPQFSFHDNRIVFRNNDNLYAWTIATGELEELTNLKVVPPKHAENGNDSVQQNWLKADQLQYLQVLKSRKEKKDAADAYNKSLAKNAEPRLIDISGKVLRDLSISPDGRFVNYSLTKPAPDSKPTIVENYVTETGYAADIPSRPKVGSPSAGHEFFLYDREKDTVLAIKTDSLPGIRDLPDYVKDYPKKFEKLVKNPLVRVATVWNITWSPAGTHAMLDVRSGDNKDRWLVLFDPETYHLKLIDRQRDEAWVGGPGTYVFGDVYTGWIDENSFWFQSEATGYSHLYSVNVQSGEKKALTSGKYEVLAVQLAKDRKYFYITTNEVHPGEQQFYRLPVNGGKAERLTAMTGANHVTLSPDEKTLAILYSYSNKPWELYLQQNLPGATAERITTKAMSDEFASYPWRDPEVITFKARDGADVYARVYKPAVPKPGAPAVLFVHGAGYLQNAHKWWSYYFREFMFNNLLADNGYYVMDIDYRGSAGYGRDWRTAIYRHMGGKDLDDNVDAANYLVKTYGVDPSRIGLYGGSYGGFLTLMALFTTPDVFAAGAALRPVTDWANYNHGYTSDILNEPFNDSLAYHRSSPIYFADGLKSHLLICHGVVDTNVEFQDAVKLVQRLIELGKDNWQIAIYPMEDHGFLEPSSWTDEYKRIFNLFESVLKK